MVKNGYSSEFAEKTFSQLEGFGSYVFPKIHAASFELIAYASNYIKCHYADVLLRSTSQQPADGLLCACPDCR